MALLVLSACNGGKDEFSLLFSGDIMLARAGQPLFQADRSSPWGDLDDIRNQMPGAVFAANLESPLGTVEPGSPPGSMNLCAPTENVDLLKEVDINLVTNANNHAADCSLVGKDLTEITLQQNSIAGQNRTAETIVTLTSGQEISYIAVNAYSQQVDLESVAHLIKQARAARRLVVVSIHWGMEYQAGPTRDMENLAAKLVDAGADIIWGHHPHVLQRMEWISSTLDGHQALVMYSLGNLLSDQWMLPDALKEAVIRLQIRDGQITGIQLIPLTLNPGEKQLKLANLDSANWIKDRFKLSGLYVKGVSITTWGQDSR